MYMHQRIPIKSENKSILYISKTVLGSSFQTNLHCHPNIEILLIEKGNGYIQTTNRKINVKENDLIIINQNCKHCEISNNLTFYAIGINKLNIFLKENFIKKIIYFTLDSSTYTKTLFLYKIIFSEASQCQENYLSIIESSLQSLFLIIKRQNNLIFNTTSKNESDLVSNVKNIIENNYQTELKLNDIASRLSVSKSKLCHQFKSECNISIIEYKLNCQMQEATNLLILTDMNISQISAMIGFNNTSYFTKYFKSKFKLSPCEYRKKHKTNV